MSHTPAAVMTDVATAPPLPISAASSLSLDGSSASRLLYKDSLQTIFAFLPIVDLRSANSVSQQWHAAVASTRQAESLRIARLTAQIRSGLFSSDSEEQVSAVKAVRTIHLSDKDIRAFWPLLTDPAVVSKFIALLSHPSAFVATHCALALGNVAGRSQQARLIVQLGAIEPLVRWIGSKHAEAQENAMFCLRNISAGSTQLRDQVIAAGALTHMTIRAVAPVSSAADLLYELCDSLPLPPWAAVSPALPLLVQLLQSDDEQVLIKVSKSATQAHSDDGRRAGVQELIAMWLWFCVLPSTLAHHSVDHTPDAEQIQAILDCGAAPRLIRLLGHASDITRKNALAALRNLTTGSEAQTQTLLDAGLAVALRPLVMAGNLTERWIACWAISNRSNTAAQCDNSGLVLSG